MKIPGTWFVLIWAGVCTAALAGLAQAETVAEPTNVTIITSDSLTFDAQKHYAFFKDNVLVADPDMKLRSLTLTVTFDDSNQIEMITAEGNVVITQEDKSAWAEKAVYTVTDGKIVLTGEPRVMRGKDILEGGTITFFRNENKMVCEDRAKLVIHPQENKKGGRMGLEL